MAEIEINNLIVKYSNKKKEEVIAIDNLSTSFLDGEINVILGPSGCGKTTLLRTLLGLEFYEGNITLDGANIDDYTIGERNFAYVSQKIALQPHMSIFDNIAYPLKIRGVKKEEIVEQVNKISEELDIKHCLSRKPKQISIGQAQRVAIARALIKDASFYFFDEPLSNLDPLLKAEQRQLIKKIIKEHHASALYVTHDLNEATALADNIIVMDEGKIIFKGTANELLNSNNPIVKSLITSSYEE